MRGAEPGSRDRYAQEGTERASGPEPAEQGPGGRPDEQALLDVLDVLDEAVVVVDPAGTVVRSNAMARRLLGDLPPGRAPAEGAAPVLREAVSAGRGFFEAEHAGRWLTGRRAPLPGGSAVWLVRDTTTERADEKAPLGERERDLYLHLARVGRSLSGTLNLRRTWGLVARLTAEGPADQCAVTLRASDAPAETAVARSGDGVTFALDEPPGPGQVRVLATGRLELHRDLTPSQARDLCPPGLEPSGVGTVLLLPLEAEGSCFGVMTLLRAEPYSPAELSLIRDHANRVSLALDAARLYDRQVRISERLRSALLPPALPDIPGLRLGAAYRPASAGSLIGGDFYDLLRVPAGQWLFALGDVCGKGVDAAVYTGRVRQALRTASVVDPAPMRMLELLNRTLLTSDEGGFVTLVIGRPRVLPDGAVLMTLAGGGHPPPLILRRDGGVESVELPGMFAGAFPEASFAERDVLLAPGDALYLYTDGITEARDGSGRMYGEERLARDLGTCTGAPPGAVVERLEQLTLQYLHHREHDDIALLGLQAWPPGRSGEAS